MAGALHVLSATGPRCVCGRQRARQAPPQATAAPSAVEFLQSDLAQAGHPRPAGRAAGKPGSPGSALNQASAGARASGEVQQALGARKARPCPSRPGNRAHRSNRIRRAKSRRLAARCLAARGQYGDPRQTWERNPANWFGKGFISKIKPSINLGFQSNSDAGTCQS
ncbi:hypothetical protein ACTMU2_39410 [Cupriavidus basilensis]